MFGPPYRILFSIIIGWAILLYIYPIIAAIIGVFAIGAFFFWNALNAVRNGVTGIAYGFHVLPLSEIRSHLDFGFVFYFVLSVGWLLVV